MDDNSDKLLGCFISIPKCATHTIANVFELGEIRDSHYKKKSKQNIIYENHQRLKVLEAKYDLKNIYTFTFVRHPYDRIKSWYYYCRDMELYKNQTLNEWIANGCKTHWQIQNETDWEKENISPLLQYNFVEANKKVDYIGKIENFEEDCKNIISQLNTIFESNNIDKKIIYNFIRENKSNKICKDEITDENKNLIYEMFKKDFDYFNYEK